MATSGSAGRIRRGPAADFQYQIDDLGTSFPEVSGARGLEILFRFQVRFHVRFDGDFWVDLQTLGVLKQGLRTEGIAKNNFSQKSGFS